MRELDGHQGRFRKAAFLILRQVAPRSKPAWKFAGGHQLP